MSLSLSLSVSITLPLWFSLSLIAGLIPNPKIKDSLRPKSISVRVRVCALVCESQPPAAVSGGAGVRHMVVELALVALYCPTGCSAPVSEQLLSQQRKLNDSWVCSVSMMLMEGLPESHGSTHAESVFL